MDIETSNGTGGIESSTTPVSTPEKAMSSSEVLKVLENNGTLKRLIERVAKSNKKLTFGRIALGAVKISLSSEQKAEIFAGLKKKNKPLVSELEEHAAFIHDVIERTYLLKVLPEFVRPYKERFIRRKEYLQRKIGRAKNEDKKEDLEEALEEVNEVLKSVNGFTNRVKNAPLGDPINKIIGEEMGELVASTPEEKTMIAERYALATSAKVLKEATSMPAYAEAFAKGLAKHAFDGNVKPRSSRAAARQIAKTIEPIITSLNEVDGSLKHIAKFDPDEGNIGRLKYPTGYYPTKTGVTRGAELATSFAEMSAVKVWFTGLAAASMSVPVAQLASEGLGQGLLSLTAYLLVVYQSLKGKGALEKEIVLADTVKDFGRQVFKKHRLKLSMMGLSAIGIGGAIVDSNLITEQSKRVQQVAHIEENIDHIADEIAQVVENVERPEQSLRPYPVVMYDMISRLLSGDDSSQEFVDVESVSEKVEQMPQEVRRRLAIAIQAEAGVSAGAIAQAKEWGMPLSGKPLVGPRVLALAQLGGFTVSEIEELTGLPVDLSLLEESSHVEGFRANLRRFAEENNLDDFLDDEEMENLQDVLDALTQQFNHDSGDAMETFATAAENFLDATAEITTATEWSVLAGTLLQFSGGASPRDLRYYAQQMEDTADVVEVKYNAYADKISQLSRMFGDSLKDVYVANDTTGRARNIDVNKIALTPPKLQLKFERVFQIADDVDRAMSAIMSPDVGRDQQSLPLGDIDTELSRISSSLQNTDERMNEIIRFFSNRDAWEEIMELRYGKLSEKERDSKIVKSALLTSTSALAVILFVFGVSTVPSAFRIRRLRKEYGEQNKENLDRAEDQIAESLRKAINTFIQENQTIANRNEKNGLKVTFPYELVTPAEVKRAIRLVFHGGLNDTGIPGIFNRLFSRSSYIPELDEVADFSKFFLNLAQPGIAGVLKKPKDIMRIVDILLPGWDMSIGHMRDLEEEKDSPGLGKNLEWSSKGLSLDPKISKRASDIASLVVQSEIEEYNIATLEAFLNPYNKIAKKYAKKKNRDGTLLAILPSALRKKYVDLPDHKRQEFLESINFAGSGEAIKAAIVESYTRLNRKRAKIDALYKGTGRNPKKSAQIGKLPKRMNTFRGRGLYKRPVLRPLTKEIIEIDAKEMRGIVKRMVNAYRGDEDLRAFSPNEAYIMETLRKAGISIGKELEDTPVTEEQKKSLDARMSAVDSVVRKTLDSFQSAVNKEFSGRYQILVTPVKSYNNGEGAVVEITVHPEGKKRAPAIITERVQINNVLSGTGTKGVLDSVTKDLVGGDLAKLVKSGKFKFKAGPQNNTRKLLSGYNNVWNKLTDMSEKKDLPEQRKDLHQRASKMIQKSIVVPIAASGKEHGEVNQGIAEGVRKYSAHLRAKAVLSELKSGKGKTLKELKEISDSLKPTDEDIFPAGSVMKADLLKHTQTLFNLFQSKNGTPGITASFDFMKNQFKVNTAPWVPYVGKKTLSADEMDSFLSKFVAEKAPKLQEERRKKKAKQDKKDEAKKKDDDDTQPDAPPPVEFEA